MRPSNSGIATCMAASSGVSPAGDVAHAARLLVAHTAWITGTSSAASASARQVLQSAWPSTAASAAVDPPEASTVVTSASMRPCKSSSAATRPSASGRSEYAHTHSAFAPATSSASASASTKAVFPVTRCER